MSTPEEQFTEALNDVNNTLTTVNENLANVLNAVSVTPIAESNVPNRVVVTNASGNSTTSSITTTELNYLDNLSGNVQAQLDNRLSKNLGINNCILRTDANGNVTTTSSVTVDELSTLDGVTSNVQTQLNSKQDARRFNSSNGVRKLLQKLSTGTTNLYAKLCTWSTTQDGQKLMIKGAGSSGFNGYSIQQFELAINVNAANGHDDGAGQGYFSAQCYMHDMQNHRETVRVYLIQSNMNTCEVWAKLPEYCTLVYEILVSADNEVNVTATYQASAPTSDSKYIYTPQALAKLGGWKSNSVMVTGDNGEMQVAPSISRTELGYLDGATSNIQNQINGNTLVGEIKWVAHNQAVTGWLFCDGRAVSRTEYARLFEVLGTTWGAGDGSTTFNLPDLQNKTVWGSTAAGSYKQAGLPNITGELSNVVGTTQPTTSGALSIAGTGTTLFTNEATGDYTTHRIAVDASQSSSIYGRANTVQPPAATLRPFIKY